MQRDTIKYGREGERKRKKVEDRTRDEKWNKGRGYAIQLEEHDTTAGCMDILFIPYIYVSYRLIRFIFNEHKIMIFCISLFCILSMNDHLK